MTSLTFRQLISGSLTFAFLVLTWRGLASPFPGQFTTWDLIPTQRQAVWDLILQPDPEGPPLIFHEAWLLQYSPFRLPLRAFVAHSIAVIYTPPAQFIYHKQPVLWKLTRKELNRAAPSRGSRPVSSIQLFYTLWRRGSMVINILLGPDDLIG